MTAHLDAARMWAEHGVPVFPIVPRAKNPMTANGLDDASVDDEAIEEWWSRSPKANLGGATGKPCGRWVLDIDGPEGRETLALLEATHGPLPATMTTITGRGEHRWFLMPEDVDIRNSAGKVGPGIDVRGTGGYVVLPPSVHPDGSEYRLADDRDAVHAPPWLIRLVTGSKMKAFGDKVRQQHVPLLVSNDVARIDGMVRASCERIRAAIKGTRNATVNDECYAIGGWLDGLGSTVDYVAPALEDAADAAEQPRDMVRRSLEDGRKKPRGRPPDTEPQAAQYAPRSHSTGRGEVDIDMLSRLAHSDLGNAKRLDIRFGVDLRWSEGKERWLTWLGTHWEWDERRLAHRWAQETVERIQDEVQFLAGRLSALGDPEEGESLATSTRHATLKKLVDSARKHAASSQASSRISAAPNECRALPGRAVALDDLDTDPWLLNTLTGTVDLRTGDCRPHLRNDLITRVAPVQYDPRATCPRWVRFMSEIFPDDAVRGMVQRALGYSLSGDVRDQVWFVLKGEGSNGKSTLLEVVRTILGRYAIAIPAGVLEQQLHEKHETELVDFKGARFASGAEPRKGKRWDAEKVKRLTGEDRIKARAMREDFFEFNPTHKLWVSCNDAPSTDDSSYGFWRRLIVIPFLVQFRRPEDKVSAFPLADATLGAALREELPGILNWLIAGFNEWRSRGLMVPEACVIAAREYRHEQDEVAQFLVEECERGPGFSVASSVLFAAYRKWREANGLDGKGLSNVQFGKALTRENIPSFEGGKRKAIRGDLKLKGEDPEPDGRND